MPDPIVFDTQTINGCPAGAAGSTSSSSSSSGISLSNITATPVAAWGSEIPLADGVELEDLVPSPTPSNLVEESPRPNARYELLVVETPRIVEAGETEFEADPSNQSKIKKVPYEEFTHRYTGEVRSYEFNVRGGDTDESLTIASIFEWCLQNNGASTSNVIIRSRDPGDTIYINRLTTLYASNTHVFFRTPVVFGDRGGLRIMGDQPEVLRNGKTLKASLRETATEGSTVLKLSASTPDDKMNALDDDFQIGDVIVLRGQNDIYGKALSKQVVHVLSIDTANNNLNLYEELEQDFEPTYLDSDWPADLTTGTTIALAAYAALTQNATAGSYTVRVNRAQLEASGIEIGSMVLLATNETEGVINSHAHNSSGTLYKNASRLEWKKVVRVTVFDATNSLVTFDTALVDNYTTATFGGITLVTPVVNSSINGVRASYNDEQLNRNTHGIQIGYSYRCWLKDCIVDGSGGQRGNGIRLSHSLECYSIRCGNSNPAFYDSGEGYGHAIYYAERCKVINGFGEGCRHNFLVQKSNGTQFAYCDSINDRISGFDVHGVRSFNTHFFGCRGYGGPMLADDATHKSIFRVGNTSHACGDFGTVIQACFIAGAEIEDEIETYAALEVFGASSDITFLGNYIADCDVGIRAGYDNDSVSEPDAITNLVQRNNTWVRITNLKDYKSTSTVTDNSDGITIVEGALASSATFANVITTSSAPDITTGDQILSTSYTPKAPKRIIKVECWMPYMSTGTATNSVITLWETHTDGGTVNTCIGTSILRMQTTGANSGQGQYCVGYFAAGNFTYTIQARFGVNATATLTVNSRFANHATQQPKLIITEMP